MKDDSRFISIEGDWDEHDIDNQIIGKSEIKYLGNYVFQISIKHINEEREWQGKVSINPHEISQGFLTFSYKDKDEFGTKKVIVEYDQQKILFIPADDDPQSPIYGRAILKRSSIS